MDAIIVENVRVFDGRGLSAPRAVFVEGGRVVEQRPAGRTGTVDGRGGTLLPGLIDTHVHVQELAELERCAQWGVTTVLDMATPHPRKTFPLRHQRGIADLFSAGYPAVAPGARTIRKMGYPAAIAVTGPGDADQWVKQRMNDGVDYIKVIIEDPRQPGTKALDAATVAAVVDAAHRSGLKVIGHAVTEATVRLALEARVDVLAHVPIQAVVGSDLTELATTGRIVISPTLVMMQGICQTLGRKPVLRALAALRVIPKMEYENARASAGQFHAAGLTILAGTDANADPTAPFSPAHGEALHHELGLLVDAGLTPVETLRAATAAPAAAFGLDRGVIEPGRRADLLLVDGDPTLDISHTARIRHVWISGEQVR